MVNSLTHLNIYFQAIINRNTIICKTLYKLDALKRFISIIARAEY